MNHKLLVGVVAHKTVVFPDIPYHIPICAGAYKNQIKIERAILLDNTEDNITHKNGYYNELTAHYWLWKNKPDYEYIGICHYRRYFNFSPNKGKYPRLGEAYLWKNKYQKKYGWDEEIITKALQGADVIVPRHTARCKPESSIAEFFGNDVRVQLMQESIQEKYPEYVIHFEKLLKLQSIHSFNMFIMKKEWFDEYSAWLFSILETFEEKYRAIVGEKMGRSCGEMGEYLLNVRVG